MAAAKRGQAGAAHGDADGTENETAFDAEAAKLSYEEAVARLEEIIEKIEQGEVGLEESLREYRRARALLRRCQSILDVAEQDVRRLTVGDVEQAGQMAAHSTSQSAGKPGK